MQALLSSLVNPFPEQALAGGGVAAVKRKRGLGKRWQWKGEGGNK